VIQGYIKVGPKQNIVRFACLFYDALTTT